MSSFDDKDVLYLKSIQDHYAFDSSSSSAYDTVSVIYLYMLT